MVLLQNRDSLLPLQMSEKFELYGCGDEVHFRAETGSAAGTKPFVPSNPCQADDVTACMYPNDALAAAGVNLNVFRLDDANSGPRDSSAVAVVCVTAASKNSEGTDRQNLDLLGASIPWSSFSRSVVWVVSPGPVLIPFADQVGAVLYSGLPGEMGAAAFADILFGRASPTGHLSLTLPNHMDETPVRVRSDLDDYSEGVIVGHRWYQANGKHPNFAFGWGLSYATRLLLSDAQVATSGESLELNVTLRWDGASPSFGSVDQVVQVYVQHRAPAPRSYKELAGFGKVHGLESGDGCSARISFEQPQIWASAPGDRDGFDAGWDKVTEFGIFVSLFGVEDPRPVFNAHLVDGALRFEPLHDFVALPIEFDQDAVVDARLQARRQAFTV
jgi:beta-glucosidase